MELSIIIGRATQADIVAAGVKPTISGYEPDELGLLAISVNLLYHILDGLVGFHRCSATISLNKQKKRERNGNPFRSLFVIYGKFRICITNASGYAHPLI